MGKKEGRKGTCAAKRVGKKREALRWRKMQWTANSIVEIWSVERIE